MFSFSQMGAAIVIQFCNQIIVYETLLMTSYFFISRNIFRRGFKENCFGKEHFEHKVFIDLRPAQQRKKRDFGGKNKILAGKKQDFGAKKTRFWREKKMLKLE
jgi:hypothetical protein